MARALVYAGCGEGDQEPQVDEPVAAPRVVDPPSTVERPLVVRELDEPSDPYSILAALELDDCSPAERERIRVSIVDVLPEGAHYMPRELEITEHGAWRTESFGLAVGLETPTVPWRRPGPLRPYERRDTMRWSGAATGRLSAQTSDRIACAARRLRIADRSVQPESCIGAQMRGRQIRLEVTPDGARRSSEMNDVTCGANRELHAFLHLVRDVVGWERVYGFRDGSVARTLADSWARSPSCFDGLAEPASLELQVVLRRGSPRLVQRQQVAPTQRALWTCLEARAQAPGWRARFVNSFRDRGSTLAELALSLSVHARASDPHP